MQLSNLSPEELQALKQSLHELIDSLDLVTACSMHHCTRRVAHMEDATRVAEVDTGVRIVHLVGTVKPNPDLLIHSGEPSTAADDYPFEQE